MAQVTQFPSSAPKRAYADSAVLAPSVFSNIERLKDHNCHTLAYLEASRALRLHTLEMDFSQLNRRQQEQGYLSVELGHKRDSLYTALLKRAKELLSPA